MTWLSRRTSLHELCYTEINWFYVQIYEENPLDCMKLFFLMSSIFNKMVFVVLILSNSAIIYAGSPFSPGKFIFSPGKFIYICINYLPDQ